LCDVIVVSFDLAFCR